MRQELIEATTFPHLLMMEALDTDECPQKLVFDASHSACRQCEKGQECRWLKRNDEFRWLAQLPMEELIESLEFCIEFVNARCFREKHNVMRCTCESCAWVRHARRLAWNYWGINKI